MTAELRRADEGPQEEGEGAREAAEEEGGRGRRRRIRCPRCGFEPRAQDLWGCLCGHAFHTFDTGGRCPGCQERWEHTQCPACHAWSPHGDWYEH